MPRREFKIITEHVFPPIPIRSMDWWAAWDDYSGENSDPIGTGSTEKEAVQDLVYNMCDEQTIAHRDALAKLYPCPNCCGTGLSAGWMDEPCDACASTGTEIET